MLTLAWAKLNDGWYQFDLVNINYVVSGVYVIWHAGNPARSVKVGQGDINSRLSPHRNDPAIPAYRQSGRLYITWAAVPAHQIDGVERYLADYYKPLVGDRYPDVAPIPVNLPGAA